MDRWRSNVVRCCESPRYQTNGLFFGLKSCKKSTLQSEALCLLQHTLQHFPNFLPLSVSSCSRVKMITLQHTRQTEACLYWSYYYACPGILFETCQRLAVLSSIEFNLTETLYENLIMNLRVHGEEKSLAGIFTGSSEALYILLECSTLDLLSPQPALETVLCIEHKK